MAFGQGASRRQVLDLSDTDVSAASLDDVMAKMGNMKSSVRLATARAQHTSDGRTGQHRAHWAHGERAGDFSVDCGRSRPCLHYRLWNSRLRLMRG
jgi:hypothetical protein